jgi:hypothetical protein
LATVTWSAVTREENCSGSWLPVASIQGIVAALGSIIGNQLVQIHGS